MLYLHIHGGGMKGGMPEMSDAANLELSRRHGIPVVSASYRLAPEDPFPAGVDDGLAVARWLLDNGGKAAVEGGFGPRRMKKAQWVCRHLDGTRTRRVVRSSGMWT